MTKTRRVLVLGSGARENALAAALARSPSVTEVVVAPGNAGSALRADVDPNSGEAVAALALREAIDLVVVGPEGPLCAGVVDALEARGVRVFGPTKSAAALEGSKAFLKRFATRHDIPTAAYAVTSDIAEAEAILRARGAPIVVKADGLCAGKGVVVASSIEEAIEAARSMLVEGRFGEAGKTIVIEECLVGEEASVHAISDGERLFVLPTARDHKRIGDGDRGPNTGGMGVVAPAPILTPELLARVERTILRPTIDGMRAEGTPFRGVLFAGLMVTPAGDPMLLEHNVRFGDPECEAMMALLEGDVGALLASVADGALDATSVRVADRTAVVVILAAHGYPEAPRKGDAIAGLEAAGATEGVVVHHAGTALRDGAIVTAGGRVLAVTATGASVDDARSRAYRAADAITFEGKHMRRDIGLAREVTAGK